MSHRKNSVLEGSEHARTFKAPNGLPGIDRAAHRCGSARGLVRRRKSLDLGGATLTFDTPVPPQTLATDATWAQTHATDATWAQPPATDATWLCQIAAAPLSERATVLEAIVVAQFKAWLLMSVVDDLPLEESYFELGLTSLGAVEIQQELVAGLGRPFDAASLYNNPTVGHLLRHLRAEVLPELFAPTVPVKAGTDLAAKEIVADILAKLYQS